MTLAADLQADWAYSCTEVVTFTDLDGNATTNVYGLRGGLNYREATLAAAGAYHPADMTWELWTATLGGEVPQPGCTVTDSSSVVYTIVSASEVTIGATSIKWRCVCRKQR